MPQPAATALSGWGNHPLSTCHLTGVENAADARRQLENLAPAQTEPTTAIARGLGRSYGDQATNHCARVYDCQAMDRYLAFDPELGELHVEAGASLEQIIADFAPRGYFPQITPGTKYVTIGGCIANDVHGKAHHADGSFVRCVREITVALADGQIVRASREQHSDLFWASFGGLGLLGIILSARITLRRIESTWFRQKISAPRNLDDMLAALEADAEQYPYSVAWIDPLARGSRLGLGVLTSGDHARKQELPPKLQAQALRISPKAKFGVPFRLPSHTLNGLTVRLLNRAADWVQASKGPFAHYESFFYPLDIIRAWNRGYGKLGLSQYQFVIPFTDARAQLGKILETIASSDQLPFLNVLKTMGEEEGILSFPAKGLTLAIDFPIRRGLADLFSRLDRMVIDAGGRVYLGKDAFLDADSFRQMYGARVDRWLAIKAKYDPEHRFSSDIARRLGLVHSPAAKAAARLPSPR